MKIGFIFPHQLYENNPFIEECDEVYIIEEDLFFKQFNFHKQKIAFHRASMKFYESCLLNNIVKVIYIESKNELSDVRKLIHYLKENKATSLSYIDPTDDWLERRIVKECKSVQLKAIKWKSPQFINSSEDIASFFATKNRMFQTDFYKFQRIKNRILLENHDKPMGGKWTFDDENRLKYPKDKLPPATSFMESNKFTSEAILYTEKEFPYNYGQVSSSHLYPVTFDESRKWFDDFLKFRFSEFGAYEDAIVSSEYVLHHSILTPMLNVGLLTPDYIIHSTIDYAENHEIPLNSLEGFIRQIMGWREFIRAVYELKGREERTKNYWGFTRKIPPSFWTGTTGIEPIDRTIIKVLETGYCHHIERLMVLGNFMLLCEFDPNEVYRWFMELFIDAYDWVMVPNVYGMSQFADGGLMATKPYISGSNYLMKMSDYKKGDWQPVWDGLFWRFMHVHRDFFLQNPRLGMLVRTFDKMDINKQKAHIENAEKFIKSLQAELLKTV